MSVNRTMWRPFAAALVIAHGWAHAVLPLRGLFEPEQVAQNFMPVILYGGAMLGFTAAGLGLLGIRPLTRFVRPLLAVAAVFSLVSLEILGQWELWWGGVIDVVLLVGGLSGVLSWRPAPDAPACSRLRVWTTQAVAVTFLAYTASAVLWPVYRAWGAQPGDDENRRAALEIQHGVTIAASPGEVWPWLLQLGQDRAGFYSYDWLERAFGVDVHNVPEIRPEWQHRAVGDLVRATQPTYLGGLLGPDLGWRVIGLEPERALVLEHWGTFALVPTDDGATRFIIRTRIGDPHTPVWAAALDMMTFQLPHFIMERRMMLRIKTLAEEVRS
jgi:uncharacterized protein YndB with AHSA1/START domain